MGPRPEYPRPALRRAEWQSLNGEWEFGAGDEPVFDRRIVVPFCPESELSGIGRRAGDVVWYRRRFDAPEAERLHLHFGAVDYRATVWLNDVEVARHEGGHGPFTAEVTAAARTGENVLVVRAEDPLSDKTIPRGKQHWTETPEGIFYTATTGIWQNVWLEPLPARHVTRLRLVPDLRAGADPARASGAVDPRLAPPLRPRGAARPGPRRKLLRPSHRGGQGRAVLAQRRTFRPAPGPGPGVFPRRPADRGERRRPAP